jgi:hypothetical protein
MLRHEVGDLAVHEQEEIEYPPHSSVMLMRTMNALTVIKFVVKVRRCEQT